MGYLSLVDIGLNVDDSTLRAELDERPTEDRVQELLAAKVESYVEEHLGSSDHEDRISALESLNTCGKDINNLVDESDVQSLIDNAMGPDEDRVQEMIDQALGDASNTDLEEYERRLDRYASKVDQLTSDKAVLSARVDNLQSKLDALISGTQGVGTDTAVLEAQVLALSEDVGRKAEQVRILQSRVDAMEALQVRLKVTDTLTQHQGRIAELEARVTNHGVIADLIREAARRILGL